MHYLHVWGQQRPEEGSGAPETRELRMVVSHRVGTGNQTPLPEGAEVLLITELLLQPYELPDAIMSDWHSQELGFLKDEWVLGS